MEITAAKWVACIMLLTSQDVRLDSTGERADMQYTLSPQVAVATLGSGERAAIQYFSLPR